jgi:hypothetical protein
VAIGNNALRWFFIAEFLVGFGDLEWLIVKILCNGIFRLVYLIFGIRVVKIFNWEGFGLVGSLV